MKKLLLLAALLGAGLLAWLLWFPILPSDPIPDTLAPYPPLPPLETGQIDLFNEHPAPEPPAPLGEEEFRKRFQEAGLMELLNTGTLASLREQLGEPEEYSHERRHAHTPTIFTASVLPPFFNMKYAPGVLFHLNDGKVVEIDLTTPGYLVKEGLQVGSTLEDVYKILGEPEFRTDLHGSMNLPGPDSYRDAGTIVRPGYLGFINWHDRENGRDCSWKYYHPKEQNLLVLLENDVVSEIRIWRTVEGGPSSSGFRPHAPAHKGPRYVWTQGPECRQRLEQVGLALLMYADEAKDDCFPPLSKEPGIFAFDPREIVPDFLADPACLECPAATKAGAPSPFRYFGYALANEREGMAFLAAYYDHMAQGLPMTGILTIPSRAKSGIYGKIQRLCDGIDRFYVYGAGISSAATNVNGLLPVMLELPGPHGDSGGHVLYMDGHVAWLPYPGPFPMTPAFIEGIKAVEERLRKPPAP